MSVHSIPYRNEWKSCVRYWIDHKNKIYHPRNLIWKFKLTFIPRKDKFAWTVLIC